MGKTATPRLDQPALLLVEFALQAVAGYHTVARDGAIALCQTRCVPCVVARDVGGRLFSRCSCKRAVDKPTTATLDRISSITSVQVVVTFKSLARLVAFR